MVVDIINIISLIIFDHDMKITQQVGLRPKRMLEDSQGYVRSHGIQSSGLVGVVVVTQSVWVLIACQR